MKALVLAGGSGTRLRPLTHTASKQLVPIANKPILFYGLESIAACGIKEVGVIVGNTKDEVMAAVGDGSRFGISVTFLEQDAPRGLAHAVAVGRDFLGDDDFVMYLGDNFLVGGIRDLVASFARRDREVAAKILLATVADPRRFGVAVVDDQGRVVRLVEKPDDPPSNLALVGVYLFDRRIHEAVAAITPSARGELEITDAISWLIASGHHVTTSMVEGYWKDLGEPEALLEGNRIALMALSPAIAGQVDGDSRIEGSVVICEGATVERSVIRGPAVIGDGARVTDSFVGPFSSIGAACEIAHTEIQNSIVLDHSHISHITGLEGSIVGRYVVVTKRDERPFVTRLVVGDHSRVELL
ncbi:MAG: glucose-1-phosphate thymidylyltransferase [Ferrimicrobium sp.]